MKKAVCLSLMFLLSCSSVERKISSAAMPYQYSEEDRYALNLKTDSNVTKLIRSFSFQDRKKIAETEPRKLTQGYYYCSDKTTRPVEKFKESSEYFSNLLNIRNPFSYLEDQYDPQVEEFVENENRATYRALACDSTYESIFKQLLKDASQSRKSFNSKHEVSGEARYKSFAYKNQNLGWIFEGKMLWSGDEDESSLYGNPTGSEQSSKLSQQGHMTNKALSSKGITNVSAFVKKGQLFARLWPDDDSKRKFFNRFVQVGIYQIESPVRTDTEENYQSDMIAADDKQKIKPLFQSWCDAEFLRSNENWIVAALITEKGTQVVKFWYENGLKSKTLVSVSPEQKVSSVEISKDGLTGVVVTTYDKAQLFIFDEKNKEVLRKTFNSSKVTLSVSDYKIYVEESGISGDKKSYLFQADDRNLKLSSYSEKIYLEVHAKSDFFTGTDNKKYPYTTFLNPAITPTFIYLFFYGGFYSESEKQISAADTTLIANGGLVIKTFLRGDSDLGPENWLSGRVEGKIKTVKDLILLTETLQKKYPQLKNKIFIRGDSNGGMVALNAVLDRPELFAGVISYSPNADMIEQMRLSNNDWTSEYGGYDRLDVLQKLSPYHKAITSSKKLPPILLRTAYDDLNVNAANSFKMLAALKNYQMGGPFYLMTRPFGSGHAAATYQEYIEENSYIVSFILKEVNRIK